MALARYLFGTPVLLPFFTYTTALGTTRTYTICFFLVYLPGTLCCSIIWALSSRARVHERWHVIIAYAGSLTRAALVKVVLVLSPAKSWARGPGRGLKS